MLSLFKMNESEFVIAKNMKAAINTMKRVNGYEDEEGLGWQSEVLDDPRQMSDRETETQLLGMGDRSDGQAELLPAKEIIRKKVVNGDFSVEYFTMD